MENTNASLPFDDPGFPPAKSPIPSVPFFPARKRELLFAFAVLIIGCLLCNSVIYAGFNLGFAVFSGAAIVCSALYLLSSGCKPTPYSLVLLVCSLVIAAAFARSDDGFVKFVLFCFLLLSVNLGLCLLAGQNRRKSTGILSLLDVPRTVFMLGLGKLSPAFRGLRMGFQESSSASKKGGAIALGLLLAIPLLAVVVPLLIRADAAFDALLQKLPDWDLRELFCSVLLGSLLACFLYTRGTALRHAPKSPADTKERKGINPLTVNTVLIAIALVYLLYLISQLAYFSGGFFGILPAGYTMAEYARRGFFEMAWICAINLGVIALGVGLTSASGQSPLLTRLLCLFLGIVTLFLVTSASAKMFMYIDAYGLTRLRILTEAIMIWLGLSTLVVCLWLFLPKLAYMKVILVFALVIGAALGWADVDTVVARYNVNAYLSGRLETVDVGYLGTLGSGATPYIQKLTTAADPQVADSAKSHIMCREYLEIQDFRDWNYADSLSDVLFYPDP